MPNQGMPAAGPPNQTMPQGGMQGMGGGQHMGGMGMGQSAMGSGMPSNPAMGGPNITMQPNMGDGNPMAMQGQYALVLKRPS